MGRGQAQDLANHLRAHSSKRVRGWAKVLRRAGFGISSVDSYGQSDLLGLISLIFDINGDHETAALIDSLNH
jgi:hypothetical protein